MSVIAPVHALYAPSIYTSYVTSVCTSYVLSVIAPIHASSIDHVCTSCITSVIAPISALPILSICLTDDEHQEFPDKSTGTNYGEKFLSKIMAKIPDDITLTLNQAKFLEETPGTTNGVIYLANFLVTLKWVKFMLINLRNNMLAVFQVVLHTMRCAHGSIAEIIMEWDPGPTYLVQRLWDPGGQTYSSRSGVATDLDKIGNSKSYLDYIHLPGLSSQPFLVTVMLNLGPNNQLGNGELTEFRQPLQVQSHLEMPGILVQLGHIQRT